MLCLEVYDRYGSAFKSITLSGIIYYAICRMLRINEVLEPNYFKLIYVRSNIVLLPGV